MTGAEFRNKVVAAYLTILSPTLLFWQLHMFPGWLALSLAIMGVITLVPVVIMRHRRVKAIEAGEYWEIDKKDEAA